MIAGYNDVMTTASSSRPRWLAEMNKALAVTSKNPAMTPKPRAGRSNRRGARVARTAMLVAVNEPIRVMAAIHYGEPAA